MAEIDVDIGKRYPLRVEETLEQQPVLEWVDSGNPKGVGDQASGRRSSPRPHLYPLFLCVLHEIPYDKEVAGKPQILYGFQLLLQPLCDLHGYLGEALFDSFERQVLQEGIQIVTLRRVVTGQIDGIQRDFHVASRSYINRVRQRLGEIGEKVRHLVGGLHVKLLGGESHTRLIGQQFPGLDTQKIVVGLAVLGLYIMDVVGGHQSDALPAGELHQHRVHADLFLYAVVHQFDVEVIFTEDSKVLVRDSCRQGVIPCQEGDRYLPFQAGA